MHRPDISDDEVRRYADACDDALGLILAMLEDNAGTDGPSQGSAYLSEVIDRIRDDGPRIVAFLQALGTMATGAAVGWSLDIENKYSAGVLARSVHAKVKPRT